jgi:hypothetical protein
VKRGNLLLIKEFNLKRPVQVATITKQLRVREIQLSEKYQQNVYVSIAPAISEILHFSSLDQKADDGKWFHLIALAFKGIFSRL